MAQSPQTVASTLPGPVTSPGAHLPDPLGSISLHTLCSASSISPATVDAQTKRNQTWKYEGYKALSKWMASEDDFFIFRRFESLNAGVILWMQDRIVQIEERLEAIHKMIEDSPSDHNLKNCSFRWDRQYQSERTKLMEELSAILHRYNEYIEVFAKVRARPRAEKRQIKNVKNWLDRGAIDPEESNYINQTGDLICVNTRTQPSLAKWLQSWQWLHRLFRLKKVPDLHLDSKATLYSNNIIFENLSNMIIILGGLAMLLSPLWWLEYVLDSVKRLQIITGFVCVFCLLMTMSEIKSPREVVAASAAYAAVLMVFMQIENKNNLEGVPV